MGVTFSVVRSCCLRVCMVACSGSQWLARVHSGLRTPWLRRACLHSCPPPTSGRLLLNFAAPGPPHPRLKPRPSPVTHPMRRPRIGPCGRFAQVKEEREARGTRSKAPTRFDPAHAASFARPMVRQEAAPHEPDPAHAKDIKNRIKIRAECSRACATGCPASCP